MGSYGSGRRRSRYWLSELLKLSLADFRQGDLAAEREWTGRVYRWQAAGEERGAIAMSKEREGLRLSHARAGKPIAQHIGLRYLPRHFGGSLVVAVCPGCWRQVRVLLHGICLLLQLQPLYGRRLRQLEPGPGKTRLGSVSKAAGAHSSRHR
jgi:hypothetical protein